MGQKWSEFGDPKTIQNLEWYQQRAKSVLCSLLYAQLGSPQVAQLVERSEVASRSNDAVVKINGLLMANMQLPGGW